MLPYLTSFRVRADGPHQLGEGLKPAPASAPALPSLRPIFVRLQASELPDALLLWELAALAGCGPDNLSGQGVVSDKWFKRLNGAIHHGLVVTDADGRIDRGALRLYLGSINESAEGGLASWLGKDAAGVVGEIVKTSEAKGRLIREGLSRYCYLLDSPTRKGNEDIKACRPPNGGNWVWSEVLAAMKKRDAAASHKSGMASAVPSTKAHKFGFIKGGM